MDLVGVEVNLAVAVTLWEGFFCESRFRPSPVQRRLVEGGHHGRKTGRGFYRYDAAGSRLGPAPEFEVSPDGGLADEAIAERTVLAIINEAFHALGEGIASPGDIDLALELGARHPHGPFAWADRLGLDHVVRRLDELTASEGEHFRPAAALRHALHDG